LTARTAHEDRSPAGAQYLRTCPTRTYCSLAFHYSSIGLPQRKHSRERDHWCRSGNRLKRVEEISDSELTIIAVIVIAASTSEAAKAKCGKVTI